MLKKMVLAALVVGTLGSGFVFANTPVINAKERRQVHRINQGVKNGQLTATQAAGLKQEVKDVKREKADMIKENGGKPLTAEQRKLLRQDLNKSSKQIYQEKHAGNTTTPATTTGAQQ
jgi:hypothetical protein